MDQDLAVGKPFSKLLYVVRLEHLMHRAMASPEQNPAGGNGLFGVSAHRFAGVPDHHFVERNAHGAGRVAAQMLVRGKKNTAALGERPVEYSAGVGAGANDSAMTTAKGLELGRRIDIRDRGDVVCVDHESE